MDQSCGACMTSPSDKPWRTGMMKQVKPVVMNVSRGMYNQKNPVSVYFELFNPLTPETFCKKCVFFTFWWFLGWILAKLPLIRSKMRLQHKSLPFLPPASRFSALWLGHAQKSKFWERPRFVTGGYGRHRRQWVNLAKYKITFKWNKNWK